MHGRVALIAWIIGGLLVAGALFRQQQTVDRVNENTRVVNVLIGNRARATCESAKQNRALWGELEAAVLAWPAGTRTPAATRFLDDIHDYVASIPASCRPVHR